MIIELITKYRSFGNQIAIVLGLGTFAWCTGHGMGIIETLFRAVLVYLIVSILSYAISNYIIRAYKEMDIEAQNMKREEESAMESLPDLDSELQSGEND